MNLSKKMSAMIEAARLLRPSGSAAPIGILQRALQHMSRSTSMPKLNGNDALGGFVPDLLSRLGIQSPDLPGKVSEEPVVDPRCNGKFLAGSYSNHAGTRSYKLYIPTGYHGQALPLIVMLHGCTQHPDDFAAGTQMNLVAEEQNCFVLYPAQTSSANHSKCWNWFNAADQRRDSGEPSIIAGMTRSVVDTYHIDTRRVYIAGLSAGGAMAGIMGVAYPDLYTAVGIHSGLPVGSAHDLPSALAAMKAGRAPSAANSTTTSGNIPVIVFHGGKDKTVHPRNGDQALMQYLENSVTTASPHIERGIAAGGHGYTRTIHHDSIGQAIAEQWLIHDAGHAWSGGSQRGSYTDMKGPDATREMMRFFSTCYGEQKTAPTDQCG